MGALMADHGTSHHGHAEGHGEHHIVPISTYLMVFALLMALLIITLAAASLNLGEWNLVIAITIAVLKALLVVLFFMHLRWSTYLVRVFAGAALFWLSILFVLTLQDYFSRHATLLPS
jgi:cytochrome c oxidase subunit 4